MKATTWLCPVLILLCATKLVYTAQRGSYGNYQSAMDGMDSNSVLQNDFYLSKRNKPSLSIVNPLDVLRQRLLLEIARRQMKENTRQVELNRAILKNVGKRMLNKRPYALAPTTNEWEAWNAHESQQQRHHGNMQQEPMHLQPFDLELIPSTLIFDFPQRRRPWFPYDRTGVPYDNFDIETDSDDNAVGGGIVDGLGDVDEGGAGGADDVLVNDVKLTYQPLTGQSDERHETALKKPINRSGHEGLATDAKSLLSSSKHNKAINTDYKLNDLSTRELNEASNAGSGYNNNNNNRNNNSKNNSNNDDDYQVQRYLYHLHKNHLTRK